MSNKRNLRGKSKPNKSRRGPRQNAGNGGKKKRTGRIAMGHALQARQMRTAVGMSVNTEKGVTFRPIGSDPTI